MPSVPNETLALKKQRLTCGLSFAPHDGMKFTPKSIVLLASLVVSSACFRGTAESRPTSDAADVSERTEPAADVSERTAPAGVSERTEPAAENPSGSASANVDTTESPPTSGDNHQVASVRHEGLKLSLDVPAGWEPVMPDGDLISYGGDFGVVIVAEFDTSSRGSQKEVLSDMSGTRELLNLRVGNAADGWWFTYDHKGGILVGQKHSFVGVVLKRLTHTTVLCTASGFGKQARDWAFDACMSVRE